MLIADSILQLLEIAIDQKASDLHLSPGVPPYLRILLGS